MPDQIIRKADEGLMVPAGEGGGVRVGIVLHVDDDPLTLYVWAHLVAVAMVENLQEDGVVASVVRVDIG